MKKHPAGLNVSAELRSLRSGRRPVKIDQQAASERSHGSCILNRINRGDIRFSFRTMNSFRANSFAYRKIERNAAPNRGNNISRGSPSPLSPLFLPHSRFSPSSLFLSAWLLFCLLLFVLFNIAPVAGDECFELFQFSHDEIQLRKRMRRRL